ncbi:MAG TPA: right-handed parallel beta-helix repeat-containing protein [Segeticoccus sp.]|nr:right-handed parallel beta-helix repeat-containing protein [Segeticoccus sp.]
MVLLTTALVLGLAAVVGVVVGPAGGTMPTAVSDWFSSRLGASADREADASARTEVPVPAEPPTEPPALVCGSSALDGPSTPPQGAVVVRPAQDLGALTHRHPPGTTFWLAPGEYHLGDGEYSQVRPKPGNRYVGAPGAVLDGRQVNHYAFGGHASGVHVEYLTVQNFGGPGDNMNEGVVNHDAAPGWVMSHLTVRDSAGAGVFLGDRNVLESSCLRDNGQYGFSAYSPSGVQDVTLRDNEVTGNNTDDWERRRPGCGCTGGGKFWETRDARIIGNYVHDNHGAGIWADTNNAGFLVAGNYIARNDAEGLFYEASYNLDVVANTFERNGLVKGPQNQGFPTPAVYLSESGSDERVDTSYNDTLEVANNRFIDNWGGVVAWENADRFAGSPANTSTGATTMVNPRATVQRCSTPDLIGTEPYIDDCRWKTQHVKVHDNVFDFDPGKVGDACTEQNTCGFSGVFSNYGTFPSWSPFQGTVVEKDITLHQDNTWSDNTYTGPWRFMVMEAGNVVSWDTWRGGPYNQDEGSTLN